MTGTNQDKTAAGAYLTAGFQLPYNDMNLNDSASIKTYFMAMITIIFARAINDFNSDIYITMRKHSFQRTGEFQVMMERLQKKQSEFIRQSIYESMILTATTFSHTKPIIQILTLKTSKFNQTILFMLTCEYSVEEIAQILITDKATVMTIRASIKRRFPDFFQAVWH